MAVLDEHWEDEGDEDLEDMLLALEIPCVKGRPIPVLMCSDFLHSPGTPVGIQTALRQLGFQFCRTLW